jgi:farnesol dehydrogenase
MAFIESAPGDEAGGGEEAAEMNIFISGATGFIGKKLARRLADEGHVIHALVRDLEKAGDLNHLRIVLFRGDVNDEECIREALRGCRRAYHLAAFTDVWARRREIVFRVNVTATETMLRLAGEAGVQRIVFTSTAGVLGPSGSGMADECAPRPADFFAEYDRTKAMAEELVKKHAGDGRECVTVCPTRVYGPGALNKSNSVTIIIKSFSEGTWRIIPGNGRSIGNYVFVDDVVEGHILAMEKGRSGERYILGGDNLSYLAFFQILRELTGQKRPMIKLPLPAMLTVSRAMTLFSRVFGTKPMITPALVRKFNADWNVSSAKAERELGYRPVSFKAGAQMTLDWIRSRKP